MCLRTADDLVKWSYTDLVPTKLAVAVHLQFILGEFPLGIEKIMLMQRVTPMVLRNENFVIELHKFEGKNLKRLLMNKYLQWSDLSKRNIIVLYLITSMGCTPKVEYQIWIDFAFYTFKVGKDHLGEEEENTVVESDTYRSKRATWSMNSMMNTCLEQWWTC
ncbi:3303_t:CDS:2 [Funneliformis caledonium]|uniref:3303_t:CDS:1 n=1 Tax=Funneliformis caledonium TaxID=1117310 RepID=A0A9N8VF09_9GLOM|nr:3303_t:CDS:2 [Funneliformis caledonium]